MADEYAHPVGVVADYMAKTTIDLMEQADAARANGDTDKAYALDELAKQHNNAARELDVADQFYRSNNRFSKA